MSSRPECQFGDFPVRVRVLTSSCKEEFRRLKGHLKVAAEKFNENSVEIEKLKSRVSQLKAEKGNLASKVKDLQNVVQSEVRKRKQMTFENNLMVKEMDKIKKTLIEQGIMTSIPSCVPFAPRSEGLLSAKHVVKIHDQIDEETPRKKKKSIEVSEPGNLVQVNKCTTSLPMFSPQVVLHRLDPVTVEKFMCKSQNTSSCAMLTPRVVLHRLDPKQIELHQK